jgi:hypothetical protein
LENWNQDTPEIVTMKNLFVEQGLLPRQLEEPFNQSYSSNYVEYDQSGYGMHGMMLPAPDVQQCHLPQNLMEIETSLEVNNQNAGFQNQDVNLINERSFLINDYFPKTEVRFQDFADPYHTLLDHTISCNSMESSVKQLNLQEFLLSSSQSSSEAPSCNSSTMTNNNAINAGDTMDPSFSTPV